MNLQGLDGKTYKVNLTKYIVDSDDNRPRSSYHLAARALLRAEYPLYPLLEEFSVPGEKLYLDFFLPGCRLAVECQGEQHERYVAHFHKSKLDFYRAQARDRRKKDFCALNNITLIEFNYNESLDEWRRKLHNQYIPAETRET